MSTTTMERTKREDYPTCDDFPSLSGKQTPLNLREAPGIHEHGRKNIELSRRVGLTAFPWQCHEINAINATNQDGTWVHSDAVLICPRQNGKSLLVALIVLYRIFVLGQNVLFTAQQWETAKDLWEQTWKIVRGRKFMSKLVTSKTCSQGRGTIFLSNGGRVVFTTRSQDAGRGLTKVDLLIYDEAYNLTDSEMAALAFLVQAADDPQVFFMSSSVHRDFPQHANGRVLSSMREQALTEFDESEPVYLSEYAAPEDMDPEDEQTWRVANPSYGVISNAKKMRKIMRRMNTEEGRINFGVEALGWGEWFTLKDLDDFTPIVDPDVWDSLAGAPEGVTVDNVVAVDTTPDGENVALVAAVRLGDGRVFLSLSPHEKFEREVLVESVCASIDANDPLALVLDGSGPVATLIDPLEHSGVEPEVLTGGKVSAAYELFLRMIAERRIVHDDDPRWAAAWAVAEERATSRYRSLDRYKGNVSTLNAAAFAVWGLQEFSIPEEVDVKQKKRYVGAAVPVESVGVPSVAAIDF
ncbi:terminase large subunit [Corynebacterium minutissimum]|uniref:Putative phage associated protein n=1 Tax=Corynebacterium minutissimum TaxID=38301 RepID=A0A376CY46_9CORY|nr:terminase large subunit [Corynebacterium minutissimum]QRP60584.1 hypothetical protein I6J26_10555 [Corynebacterium minutissimum]STC76406.1 putative phage associated protein [Corynebacterium minutissimum]